MPKTLIVAEKPSVARDIAAALGGCKHVNDWLESDTVIVSSAIGHLVEIYTPEADVKGAILPIIPAGGFELRAIERTKAQFSVLKKLMANKEVETIINACDAGREGELIFRLIYDLAGCRKPVRRLWLQSMTRDSILSAFNTLRPSTDFDSLGDAARCRNESDWLVGINGSRALSRAHGQMLSAGRVQTPTLAMVVHRTLEIANFKPQDYFEVHGRFGVQAGSYIGKWQNPNPAEGEPAERCADRETAQAIQAKCDSRTPTSVTEESRPTAKQPPRLYDLTTLQRDANRRFSFSAKTTLDISQSLYERHKALTYPRTDSSALPDDYVEKAIETVKSMSGGEYKPHAQRIIENDWVKPSKRIFDNSKVSDHFAIIPTGTIPSGLSPDEAQLYDLVVRRFLAVFHPAAEYMSTTRMTVVEEENFKSTGSVLVNEGWLAVYGAHVDEDEEKEPTLCKYEQGEAVTTEAMDLRALKTKPPKPYTEATLLQAMETAGKFVEDEELAHAMKQSGLGTPATRASIIEVLVCDKDGKGNPKEPYVRREKKNLIPTQKGIDLIGFLEKNGIEVLTSAATTGAWERKLKLMEKGDYRRADFMREIEAVTREIVTSVGSQPTGELMQCDCPKCSGSLLAGRRTIECKAKCGFMLWLEIAKRPISMAEAEQLISTGSIENLQGFISAKNNPFAAGIKLDPEDGYKAKFVFSDALAGEPVKYKCPKCRGQLLATEKTVACACGFKFWKVVASRKITSGESMILITKGVVGPLNGFVSAKSGKKFSASLKMSAEFKAEFVFS